MYGKLFASTFTGSMFGAGPDVIATWAYVIANTVNETVELNPALLAAMLGAPRERVEQAIEVLCSPDESSRSPEEEGRRLVKEEGFQYRVVNHSKYRAIRNEEDRKAYNREAKRRSRERLSNRESLTDARSDGKSTMSAHTETESETIPPYPPGRGVSGNGRKERRPTRAQIHAQVGKGIPGPPTRQEQAQRRQELKAGLELNEKPFSEWSDDDAAVYLKAFPDHREKLHSALLESRGKGLPEKNP